MIRNNFVEVNRMLHECNEFIRSIWMHTEGEDHGSYEILKKEVDLLSNKVNAMIIKLDAYEQNKNEY
jgi:hypothetical protein